MLTKKTLRQLQAVTQLPEHLLGFGVKAIEEMPSPF
jgi:type III secretory pathway component EscS